MTSLETFELDQEALEAGTVSQQADLGSSSRHLRNKIPHSRVPAVGSESPFMVFRLKDAEVQHQPDQQRDDPGRPESMVVLALDYWDQPTERTVTFRGVEVDPNSLHLIHESKFQPPVKPDFVYIVVKADVPLLLQGPSGVQREVVLQDEPIKIPITADFRGFVRGFHVLCSQTKLRDCLWEKMLSIEVQQEGGPMHNVCESFAYKVSCQEETQPAGSQEHSLRSAVTAFEDPARGEEPRTEEQGEE